MFISVHPRLIGLFALLSLATVILIGAKPFFTSASRPPRGIADSMVAMEVVRSVEEVDAILGDSPSPDREVMRIKQYIDFAFIVFYAGLFASFGGRIAILGIAAAACDVVEDVATLRMIDLPLSATTQGMIDTIRIAGLMKWTLAFSAVVLVAKFFFARPRWTNRTVGVFCAAAAGLGLIGLFVNSFLVWAGIPLGLALAGIAALFFRLR